MCTCICMCVHTWYVCMYQVHIQYSYIHASVLVHLRVPGTQPKPHKPDCWRAAQHSPAGVQMALDEEEDLLVGPAPPDVSAEDELASADDRSREVLRITSCVPAHCCWVPAVMCVPRAGKLSVWTALGLFFIFISALQGIKAVLPVTQTVASCRDQLDIRQQTAS